MLLFSKWDRPVLKYIVESSEAFPSRNTVFLYATCHRDNRDVYRLPSLKDFKDRSLQMNAWLCNAVPWHGKIGWRALKGCHEATILGPETCQPDFSALCFTPD